MGLAQAQMLLAAIYTDPEIRDSFCSSPSQVGAEFGLTVDEAQQLLRMPMGPAFRFGESLRRKRIGGVRKLLPLTCQALGDRFAELFQRYAEAPLPIGHGKARQDALAFASYVDGKAREGRVPAALAMLARYETSRLRAASSSRRLTICWLPFVPESLKQSEGLQTVWTGRPSTAVVALWIRPSPRSRLRRVLLPIPWPARAESNRGSASAGGDRGL